MAAAARLELGDLSALPFPVETVMPQDLDQALGPDAIHQGVMLETRPLQERLGTHKAWVRAERKW